MLTLILGGARSGKSSLALRLALAHHETTGGQVTMIATAPRIDGDADLDDRIAMHRSERPAHWGTIEESHDLLGALQSCGTSFVIVDCLTLWVSNMMWSGDDADLEASANRAATFAAARPAPTVVVSNEVGLGIHPATESGRHYRDLLGRVNQIWAAAADRSLFMAAGRALELKNPEDVL